MIVAQQLADLDSYLEARDKLEENRSIIQKMERKSRGYEGYYENSWAREKKLVEQVIQEAKNPPHLQGSPIFRRCWK